MVQHELARPVPATGERRAVERLFHRDLPGGGYVAIEAGPAIASDHIVRVVVERRGDRKRRQGHRPPVIHEESWSARGLEDLYRLACDNVMIARRLLRLERAD